MRPLIGISIAAGLSPNGRPYHRSYAMNAQAIMDAGGLPVYVPTGLPDDVLRELYERLDGVMLPGGGDVRPVVYGAQAHPLTNTIDDARDLLEISLARWAYDDDVPLFGICRGHQVMNVALGGTLVQDIPSEVGADIPHETPDTEARSTLKHAVTIAPESRLASILGETRVQVNSLHHQAIEQIAPGMTITALAPDEVVEAMESADKTFALSVQWHPEDLYQTSDEMRRLFRSFIDAASDYALRRRQEVGQDSAR